jgi:hypothetical protein
MVEIDTPDLRIAFAEFVGPKDVRDLAAIPHFSLKG